jgi:hypothetical protein
LTVVEFGTLEVPPIDYLIKPIITNKGMYQLSAPSGHGKTRLVMSICHALSTGNELLGWEVPRPARTLYVDAEMHPGIMRQWLDRLGSKTENLRVLSDKVNYAKGWPRVTLQTVEGRKYVAGVIEECDPAFIVLDSLFTLTTPDLDRDVELWHELLPWLESLALKDRVPFLLHHDNRTGQPFGTSTREIKFEGIAQLKRVEKLNTEDRWAFKLSWYKPRHLTPEEAKPKLITVNHEGKIDWQVGDRDPNVRNTKLPPEQRAEIEKLLSEGKLTQMQIAEKFNISRVRVSQINKEMRDADV